MAKHAKSISFSDCAISDAIKKAANTLGYEKLRPKQLEAVEGFVKGRDVFVTLPTGSGKSLCYCILPVVFDALLDKTCKSIVLVVSPLIALMKDQVRSMSERGVSAVYVGDINDNVEMDICSGKYQLVYMSPEMLICDDHWRDMIIGPVYMESLKAMVVDEAHCVQKWGETFRKAFTELGVVRSLLPDSVRIMALTATATKQTRKAVCRSLGMVAPLIISQLPDRPNIKYCLRNDSGTLEEAFAPLMEEIRSKRTRMDKCIIYCRTYDSCSMIYLYFKSRLKGEITEPIGARDLARFRIVDMFTACTTPNVKDAILKSLCKPDGILRVVVATVAFGMGLDCPNIRRIIHWGPSSDIEQYVQETGRAGRDGLPSTAILYVADLKSFPTDESMKDYYKNKDNCRRKLILKHFDQTSTDSDASCTSLCKCCDICEIVCMCPACTSI